MTFASVKYHYRHHSSAHGVAWEPFGIKETNSVFDPHTTHPLVGSLAGAAQLLKDNAAVPRHAQRGQKPRGEQKGKSVLDRSRQ